MKVVNLVNVVMGEVYTHLLVEASTLPKILNMLEAHWVRESLWAIK